MSVILARDGFEIFSFATMISKTFYLRGVKTRESSKKSWYRL